MAFFDWLKRNTNDKKKNSHRNENDEWTFINVEDVTLDVLNDLCHKTVSGYQVINVNERYDILFNESDVKDKDDTLRRRRCADLYDENKYKSTLWIEDKAEIECEIILSLIDYLK